jgi:hypothetical protein
VDNAPLTKEEAAAWRLLELATTAAASELPKFSGWLMTVLGSILAFFVAHYNTVSSLVTPPTLRVALILFAVCMLAGLLAVWLTMPIRAGLAFSNEVLQLRTQQFDRVEFSQHFASGLIFPYKCLFLCRLASARPTDALSPIRSPAKLSQYQALLVLFQFACAVVLVFMLAIGING